MNIKRYSKYDKATLQEKFFSKVKKTKAGCWRWKAALNTGGYGIMGHAGKLYAAHRLSWFIHKNENPRLNVLHKCDNPVCVNPDHLFLGTQKDNVLDAIKKGRMYDIGALRRGKFKPKPKKIFNVLRGIQF